MRPAQVSLPQSPVRIGQWLASVNPRLEQYAKGFEEYGYEDTSMLLVETEEDIGYAFEELGVKKGHQRTIRTAISALQNRK